METGYRDDEREKTLMLKLIIYTRYPQVVADLDGEGIV